MNENVYESSSNQEIHKAVAYPQKLEQSVGTYDTTVKKSSKFPPSNNRYRRLSHISITL